MIKGKDMEVIQSMITWRRLTFCLCMPSTYSLGSIPYEMDKDYEFHLNDQKGTHLKRDCRIPLPRIQVLCMKQLFL